MTSSKMSQGSRRHYFFAGECGPCPALYEWQWIQTYKTIFNFEDVQFTEPSSSMPFTIFDAPPKIQEAK